MSSFVTTIISYYRKHSLLSEEDLPYLDYAIRSICSELSKILILSVAFIFLRKYQLFLFSLLVLLSTRWFSGGLHAKTYLKCLLYSFLSLYGLIVCALYIHFVPILLLGTASIFLLPFTLLRIPLTPGFRPITDNQTIMILQALYAASFCLWIIIFTNSDLPLEYVRLGLLTLLYQQIQLLIGGKK